MRTYQSVVAELEGQNIFPSLGASYWDYTTEEHPLKKQFEDLFRFGQDFLDRKDLEFQTDKARFFFSDRDAPSAYCDYTSGYFIIDFFRGQIEKQNEFYASRENILTNARFDLLRSIVKKIGIAPKDYFIQSTSQLYFYHEATHFIQKYIEYEKRVPFPAEQQKKIKLSIQLIREFDAEWYGVACVAVHAGEATATAEEIAELSVMSLSAFFLFWVERWDMNDMNIVNRQRSHPHPLVRLDTWIISLTATMKSVFNYEMDVRQTLDRALEVATHIEDGDGESKFKKFAELMDMHHPEILEFVMEILAVSELYPYTTNNYR